MCCYTSCRLCRSVALVLLLRLLPLAAAWLSSGVLLAPPAASPAAALPARAGTTRQRWQRGAAVALAKDWDAILAAEDEDGHASGDVAVPGLHVPPDMQYNRRNCERQQRHYKLIRGADAQLVRDVYVRDPQSQVDAGVFWYAGKLARVSDVSAADAARRQWALIETHAANLRPLDLFGARGAMEIWLAPGDSEMDVAYNRPHVVFERVDKQPERAPELAAAIPNVMVGFVGEVYEAGEPGFRTWRQEDGRPARPEITGPAGADGGGSDEEDAGDDEEYRAPTEEEMQKIQEALKGKDINEFYKEQQRRAGKEVEDDDL